MADIFSQNIVDRISSNVVIRYATWCCINGSAATPREGVIKSTCLTITSVRGYVGGLAR